MNMRIKRFLLILSVLALAATPVMAACDGAYTCPYNADTRYTCPDYTRYTCPDGGDASFTPFAVKPSANGQSMTAMEAELVRQVNGDRAKYGLGALTVSAELSRAACVRAKEIVQKFSHTRPDGTKWLTVSALAKGENIAKGQQTVDKVMAAWMSSSGHRQNILRASYRTIGVCAYRVGNIMYWVQLFGF